MSRRLRKRARARPLPAHWNYRPAPPGWTTRARTNVRWALGWSIPMALAYCAWAGVVALLQGSTHFDQFGVTLWTVMGTYLASALVAGILLGLCRPLLRWRLGAVVVGAVAGTSVYSAIGISMAGLQPTSFVVGTLCGVLVGGVLGWSWWRPPEDAASAAA
jgi:hypothetical protein